MTEQQGDDILQALGVLTEMADGALMAFGVVCGYLLTREVVRFVSTRNFWEWGGR